MLDVIDELLTPSERRILQEIERHGGYVRQRDILAAHIRPHALATLRERGLIEPVRRGLYRRSDLVSTDIGVADVAAAVPGGVICLLSALSHYGLTTATPWEVFLAIDRKAWRPTIDYPPVHVIYYTGAMFRYGVREVKLAMGRTVRMYSLEKCIADAFHFPQHVGREIAIEALKEYMGQRERNLRALIEAAEVCRVRTMMQPYIEALS